ncbi:lytic transglycosylase domain-containing protein [Spongorhabdus nitratireducens]
MTVPSSQHAFIFLQFVRVGYLCLALIAFLVAFKTARAPESVTETETALIVTDVGGWQSLRDGFQLSEHYQAKEVSNHLQRYDQYYFTELQPRIQLYQRHLNIRFLQTGLPAELALLPLIESRLKGSARSQAKAVGFWQFTEVTAKSYGLVINKHFDGRKDFLLSTEAAISYLQDMHRRLDNWLLVVAAYNVGETHIRKVLRRALKTGKADFWRLKLPLETRQHVARLLALSHIIHTAGDCGIQLPSLELDGMDIFYPDKSGTLSEMAARLQCSEAMLRQFNQGYLSRQYRVSRDAGLILPKNRALWIGNAASTNSL